MVEVTSLRLAVSELRGLLGQETAERLSGFQRLERGIEHLRQDKSSEHSNREGDRSTLQAEQQRLARKQAELVDVRDNLKEQFRNMDDQLAGKASKWEQRFGEMSARLEEISRVQGRLARDELAARPEVARLEEVASRVELLQGEISGKATHHLVKDIVNREIAARVDGIEREISGKATHQLVKEIVEDSKQMLSASIQDVLLQWEQRFNDLTTRFEGLASRRAQLEAKAEEAVVNLAQVGEKEAAMRHESDNRARDAESTLRRLLQDLNGIREFTETPPMLASSMTNVVRSYPAVPPPTIPALQGQHHQTNFDSLSRQPSADSLRYNQASAAPGQRFPLSMDR